MKKRNKNSNNNITNIFLKQIKELIINSPGTTYIPPQPKQEKPLTETLQYKLLGYCKNCPFIKACNKPCEKIFIINFNHFCSCLNVIIDGTFNEKLDETSKMIYKMFTWAKDEVDHNDRIDDLTYEEEIQKQFQLILDDLNDNEEIYIQWEEFKNFKPYD